MKNGDEIESKIYQISSSEVTYKKYKNLDGPIYKVSVNKIFMIKHENGEKELFNQTSQLETGKKEDFFELEKSKTSKIEDCEIYFFRNTVIWDKSSNIDSDGNSYFSVIRTKNSNTHTFKISLGQTIKFVVKPGKFEIRYNDSSKYLLTEPGETYYVKIAWLQPSILSKSKGGNKTPKSYKTVHLENF